MRSARRDNDSIARLKAGYVIVELNFKRSFDNATGVTNGAPTGVVR